MRSLDVDVVVIGGGSTGVGVVRDVAMRGYKAVLVDRVDLAQGTSGRFHGLLHSGGRYVVSDPNSARECAEENVIITRIQPTAVETTGGLFVTGPDDDVDFGDKFLEGAAANGVAATEIRIAEALAREPRLNPRIKRAVAGVEQAVEPSGRALREVDTVDEHSLVAAHRHIADHPDSGRSATDHHHVDIERTHRSLPAWQRHLAPQLHPRRGTPPLRGSPKPSVNFPAPPGPLHIRSQPGTHVHAGGTGAVRPIPSGPVGEADWRHQERAAFDRLRTP